MDFLPNENKTEMGKNTKWTKAFQKAFIAGLHGKIDEVREILLSYNFDIFSLSETSISEDFHNTFFDIRRYNSISRDWKSGQGGGVGLYIRDGIDFARRPDLENDETEIVWVEMR